MVQGFDTEQREALAKQGVLEILLLASVQKELAEPPCMKSRTVTEDNGPPLNRMMQELGIKAGRPLPFSAIAVVDRA
jgi:hypothetical protein